MSIVTVTEAETGIDQGRGPFTDIKKTGETTMKNILWLGMIGLLILSGCAAPQTNTGKGAAYGAAGGALAGAVLGQVIGGDTEGTLVGAAAGAAVGAAAGAGVGHMMDRQEAEMRDALAASEAAAVRREGEMLAVTLKGDVSFDLDSAVVRPGLYNELDRIAQIMIKYPQTAILVEGHTDSTGSEAYNQQLSERRATSVKNLLVQRGVQAYRVSILGYGESRPVATNATPEGRQMNRRVDIRINPTAQG
jgi:outer membrane protein OmpA-like peptidoglycan-associated protein